MTRAERYTRSIRAWSMHAYAPKISKQTIGNYDTREASISPRNVKWLWEAALAVRKTNDRLVRGRKKLIYARNDTSGQDEISFAGIIERFPSWNVTYPNVSPSRCIRIVAGRYFDFTASAKPQIYKDFLSNRLQERHGSYQRASSLRSDWQTWLTLVDVFTESDLVEHVYLFPSSREKWHRVFAPVLFSPWTSSSSTCLASVRDESRINSRTSGSYSRTLLFIEVNRKMYLVRPRRSLKIWLLCNRPTGDTLNLLSYWRVQFHLAAKQMRLTRNILDKF